MFKKTADLVKEVTPNDCKLQTAKILVPGILMWLNFAQWLVMQYSGFVLLLMFWTQVYTNSGQCSVICAKDISVKECGGS